MNYFNKFKSLYKNQGFPKFTVTLAAFTSLGYIYIKSNKEAADQNSKKLKKYILDLIFDKPQPIPTLPEQQIFKPTFILDFDNFLVYKQFEFLDPFRIKRRACSGTFLFHLAHLYEVVLLTKSNPQAIDGVMRSIDPYGCISYRVSVKNKKDFNIKNLNRSLETLMCVTTRENELSDDFKDNFINVKPWKGEKESGLLKLLSFASDMALLNIRDYRNTLNSYKDKCFFTAYEKVQKRAFMQKNLFSFNKEIKFKEETNKIENERIKTFEKAKLEMDQHLARDKLHAQGASLYTKLTNLIISFSL